MPLQYDAFLTESGYLNVLMIQNQVMTSTRVRKSAIAETFLLCGAFISMITRMTNLAIGAYQGFSVDKSLIKKLYSWKDNKKMKKKGTVTNDDFD